MATYKDQLLKALSESGWEQLEVNEEGIDWWGDEMWKMRSIREQWGMELYLTFLVDPLWEGPRKKSQGIWAILATSEFPTDWRQPHGKIATLSMAKRKFGPKLNAFIRDIHAYRIAQQRV